MGSFKETRYETKLKETFFNEGYHSAKLMIWNWSKDRFLEMKFKEFSKLFNIVACLHKKFPEL